MTERQAAITQERLPAEVMELEYRRAIEDRDFYLDACVKWGGHQPLCESVIADFTYPNAECTCGWTDFKRTHLGR